MRDLVLIFLGGGLGSSIRFLLGKWISSFQAQNFPYGTLVVNVLACFILGSLIGIADHKQIVSVHAKLFWTIGFCGGFSTFSTFSYETLSLIQNGFTISSILYISISVFLCVLVTFAGLFLGKLI